MSKNIHITLITAINQSELAINLCNPRQVRESRQPYSRLALTLTSDWLNRLLELFEPITERSKLNIQQNIEYFLNG